MVTQVTRQEAVSRLARRLQELQEKTLTEPDIELTPEQQIALEKMKCVFRKRFPKYPQRPMKVFRWRESKTHPLFLQFLIFLVKDEKLAAIVRDREGIAEVIVH